MNIGRKLMLGFVVLTTLLAGFGVYSIYITGRLTDIQTDLAHRQTKNLIQAATLNNLAGELGAGERDLLIGTLTNDSDESRKSAGDVRESRAAFEKTLAELRPALQTEHGRIVADKLAADLNNWIPFHEEIARLCLAGKGSDAGRLRIDRSEPLLDAMDKDTDELQASVQEVQAASAKSGEETAAWSRWSTWAIMGISLAVAAAAFFSAQRIVMQLRNMASELGHGAEQVASAAAQVSTASQALAQGASQQAAALEETSASSEQITAMARKNTAATNSAADLVASSQQKFVETNQSLEQTVGAMSEINAQSGKIANIMKTIDEIAFQTNILALNAAVEAARAGEAGLGFAVVAEEVRNLSQRCAQAASDTSHLIQESITRSNDGKSKVDQVAAAFRGVTLEAGRIKTLVGDVNRGSQEQASGVEQVGRAIVQMESVTRNTAASAEESAAAAEELTAQSAAMKGIVNGLIAMVGAG